MKEKRKVIAYITQKDKLLVFKHKNFQEAGIQVPAGTIEENEEPEKAVIRETMEETGLNNLQLKRKLGYTKVGFQQDRQERKEKMIIHQYYYHLICLEKTPETWINLEKDPSEVTPEDILEIKKYGGIVLEFYWIPISEGKKNIMKHQSFFLDELIQTMKPY